MISIDEGVVDAAAPNAEAIKNGRGLVLKNKFTILNISEDETILFGECNMNAKVAREMEEHAKQLGNAYLPGAQAALQKARRRPAEVARDLGAESDKLPILPKPITWVGCFQKVLGHNS